MAEDNSSPQKKNRRLRVRKVETVRQRAEKASDKPQKHTRLRSAASKGARPFKAVHRASKIEFYPVKVREKGRPGRFLNKRRSFIPSYFSNSWKEVKLVSWPNRKTTWQLTLAVFIFAAVFGLVISVTDYGLDKLFRRILL